MKTYTLTPTRWTEAHTLESCTEAEADLWSVGFTEPPRIGSYGDHPLIGLRGGWIADFRDRTLAEDFCAWLTNREQVRDLL